MRGIFSGVKVLSFAWVIVGTQTVKYLADQGASVVKIETAKHPDPLRTAPPFKDGKAGVNRSGYFAAMNTNFMNLGIDVRHPEGLKLVKNLVKWADVVVESFRPGVMEELGLEYAKLRQIKPEIIFLRTSMMGSTGPQASIRGLGFHLVGYTGFVDVTGWPDRPPVLPYGPYTDSVAPRFAASCLIAALLNRKRTGQGCCIDISQMETGIHFLGPLILDYQVNKRLKERQGNSSERYCPHGVYPCLGQDCWVAIVIRNDEEWQSFADVVGQDWIRSNRFTTFLSRKQNEQELNSLIAAWTIRYPPEAVMRLLQDKGIPAGVVKNAKDLIEDEQLRQRNAMWLLEHEEIGPHLAFGQGFLLSETPPSTPKPAPRLGEHAFYVCKEILGMPDEEIGRLISEGVLQVET